MGFFSFLFYWQCVKHSNFYLGKMPIDVDDVTPTYTLLQEPEQ